MRVHSSRGQKHQPLLNPRKREENKVSSTALREVQCQRCCYGSKCYPSNLGRFSVVLLSTLFSPPVFCCQVSGPGTADYQHFFEAHMGVWIITFAIRNTDLLKLKWVINQHKKAPPNYKNEVCETFLSSVTKRMSILLKKPKSLTLERKQSHLTEIKQKQQNESPECARTPCICFWTSHHPVSSLVALGCNKLLRLELQVQRLMFGVADISLSSLYAYSSKLFSRTWVTRTSSFSYICVLKGRETQRWARSSDSANQRRKWANSDFHELVF